MTMVCAPRFYVPVREWCGPALLFASADLHSPDRRPSYVARGDLPHSRKALAAPRGQSSHLRGISSAPTPHNGSADRDRRSPSRSSCCASGVTHERHEAGAFQLGPKLDTRQIAEGRVDVHKFGGRGSGDAFGAGTGRGQNQW